MRAVILAGGQGRRLNPYTLVLPKPLVPIGDLPVIEIVVRQLAHYGFERVTIAVGYHSELIMAVMGDGAKWGLNIDYSREDRPLNTVGPLRLIDGLNEPFLVMNGDLLTDLNYSELAAAHSRHGTILTIASCKRRVKLQLGVISYATENNRSIITGYREKPAFEYEVSSGIYIFDPRIFDYIPEGQPFGFDELMLRLLDENEPAALYHFEGHWLDMGTPEDLERANEEFMNYRQRYLPNE
ncbi:MAG: sugar phosphate nucleotidyltransferase [Candidatus Omnitrophota bacterium]